MVLIGMPVALATQLANAATESRPIIFDDITFHANKTDYHFEAVRALHVLGCALQSADGFKLRMLFALESTKPLRMDSKKATPHDVKQWLRSRGRPVMNTELQPSRTVTRELQECFDAFDGDQDGLISLNELRETLVRVHLFPEDMIDHLFSPQLKGGNESICFDEFQHLLHASPSGNSAKADDSSSLIESVKLVLRAYSSRQRMMRQLGDGFTSQYSDGSRDAQSNGPPGHAHPPAVPSHWKAFMPFVDLCHVLPSLALRFFAGIVRVPTSDSRLATSKPMKARKPKQQIESFRYSSQPHLA